MATDALSIGKNSESIIQSQLTSNNNTDTNQENTNSLQLPKRFTEEPTTIRKAQYGADMETNLVGDIWRLGETAIESLSPDVTWSEAREDVEQERLDWLYEKYPEFATGKYDNDVATWGGRTATLLLDPVYFVMPWGLALRGATLAGKMGKLAMMGGAVGTGDAATREYMRTGEVTPSQALLYGGGLGAAMGPVGYGVQKLGGAVLNKAFPQLFKNKEQADAVESILRKNLEKKYDLNSTQLKRVEAVSKLSSIQKLFQNIVKEETAANKFYTPMQQMIDKLQKIGSKKKYKNIKNISFKVQDKTVTLLDSSESSVRKAIKEVKNIYAKAGAKYNDNIVQSRHKHFVKVLQELEKRESLTTKMIRPLVAIAARPIVGAGGGAVYGTLFTDSDDAFKTSMWTGAAMGLTHKVLMSGRAKGISIPRQKIIGEKIKESYIKNFLRNTSIITSMSQWSKMSARGPITDSFAATLFARPTDTVQRTFLGRVAKDQSRVIGTGNSVEDLAQQNFAFLIGGISDSLGIKSSSLLDSAKGKLFKNQYLKTKLKLSLEEQNIIKAEQDALDIVRGASIKGASPEAKQMARNIKDYLKGFKKYYNDAGFKEGGKIIDNYFPRKFNFAAIENNKKQFLKDLTKIYDNLKANPKSRLTPSQRKTSSKILAKKYLETIRTPDNGDIITLNETGKIVSAKSTLPLSKHITEQRILEGSWDEVEKILKPYLINDVRGVLTDLAQTTVKSVEFARAFGTKGEAINGYLSKIYRQYLDNGFKDINNGYFNNRHKEDVKSIKDAVNSYFGRHGTQVDDWQKGTVGVLSTLANFSMMDKVTIANLGDLVQPFQNSRHWSSWYKGISFTKGNKASQQLEQIHSKVAKANLADSFTTSTGESSSLILKNGKAGNFMNIIGKSNELFFKMIGLEGITNIARRYAYNVGAIDAHKTAQLFVKQLGLTNPNVKVTNINLKNIKNKKLLNEVMHLQKTGALKINAEGNITNLQDLINLGRAKNLQEALTNTNSATIIQRVGIKAADRDAIIPTVGNRLLFTQTRNPWLRLLGQFSSWAMAKSAQTNAMISRIESGDTKQLITSLFALNVYGGIKEIREWAKYGEWNISNDFKDDRLRWYADATELSGNLGWLPNTIVNNMFGYNSNRPTDIAPAFSVVRDLIEVGQEGVRNFSKNNYDKTLQELYDIIPAPTIRKILSRLGIPAMIYKEDTNIPLKFNIKKTKSIYEKGLYGQLKELLKFSTGGLADNEEEENDIEVVTEKPSPKIKTNYQYSLKTEIDDRDIEDKKQLKELTEVKIALKEKPAKPVNKIDGPVFNKAIGLSQDKDGKYYIAHPLFDRMLEKESSRGTNLISPKGAIGLMQIMPNVHTKGNDVGFNVKTKPTKKDLENPAKNVAYAIEYYNGLKKYYGSDELALIAYNWGAGNLNEWITKGKNPNDLPKETKDYVNYILNRKLFHGGGSVSHTHGPKKPKPSSWKSLFTSNEAYGGGSSSSGSSSSSSSSSSSDDSDAREDYITSTQGGTNTGGGNNNNNNNNNNNTTTNNNITTTNNNTVSSADTNKRKDRRKRKQKIKDYLEELKQVHNVESETVLATNIPDIVNKVPDIQETEAFVRDGLTVGAGTELRFGENLFQPNIISGDISQTSSGFKGNQILDNTKYNVGYKVGETGTQFNAGYSDATGKFSGSVEQPIYQTDLLGKNLTLGVGLNKTEGEDLTGALNVTWGGGNKRTLNFFKKGGLLDRNRYK